MDKSYAQLVESFKNPDLDFGPVMMWFWKGDITREGITFQLEKFREQNVVNFFIHPAVGFNMEYLGDEHMALIRYVVDEAKRLGMHFWIYDEYEYPSGTAGGKLLREYPEYRQKELHVEECRFSAPGERCFMLRKGEFVAAQLINEKDGKVYAEDITAACEVTGEGPYTEVSYWYNETNKPGKALFYFSEYNEAVLPSSTYAKDSDHKGGYVDMLNPDAVAKFIELTHERYKEVIGDEFGKTVRGVFTDEPTILRHFDGTYVSVWGDHLMEEFEKDHGYSFLPYLYTFWKFETDRPEEIKAIHDHRATIMRIYHENFVKQISAWCKKNNLLFTGHFGGEEIMLGHVDQGDTFKQLTYFDVPGADNIFSSEQIDIPGVNTAAILSSSAAKFSGADRVLCETYTGSGWDVRFSVMRRIANRLITLGVNWIQYMGAYYTIDGNNKNFPFCYPSSHSYQNSLFPHYKELGRHMASFSAVSAATKPDNRVLMLLPVQQAEQEYYINKRDQINEWEIPSQYPGCTFTDTMNAMLYEGIGFDFFSENMLDMVQVYDGYFEVGGYRYDAMVFPRMFYVNRATRLLIESLKAHKVKMVFAYEVPAVETDSGEPFDLGFAFAPYDPAGAMADAVSNSYFVAPEGFPANMDVYRSLMRNVLGGGCLNVKSDNRIYIRKRANETSDAYFICNDDPETALVYLDAEPGLALYKSNTEQADYTVCDGRICLAVEAWDMVLAIRDKASRALPTATEKSYQKQAEQILAGPYSFTAEDGNFLPLSYEVFDEDTGRWEDCPFMAYSQKVQLKAGAPYKLRSRVLINKMPKKLYLNAEIQRLTKLSVNGTELSYHKNIERWSTADYTEDVTALFSEGENIICVEGKTTDIRMLNRPPYIYLSGAFAVGEKDVILAPVSAIAADGWEKNGYPYYTGVGVYRTSVTIEKEFTKATLTVNTEDIAEIYVNGRFAGKKLWLKDETDITPVLSQGKNEILVRISSTRANSFACPCLIDEWASQKAEARTENGILMPMRVTLYR